MQRSSEKNLEKFKCLLEYFKYEELLSWQIFGAFLLAHTVFLAFILSAGFREKELLGWDPGIFITAVVGFLLCVAWWASYRRSSAYVLLRRAQTREEEPSDLNLIGGEAEGYSEGNSMIVGGTRYEIEGWLARRLKTRHGMAFVIIVFFVVYLFVIVSRSPLGLLFS